MTQSSSVKGATFKRTVSGMPILPTSWNAAAVRRMWRSSSERPHALPNSRDRPATRLQCRPVVRSRTSSATATTLVFTISVSAERASPCSAIKEVPAQSTAAPQPAISKCSAWIQPGTRWRSSRASPTCPTSSASKKTSHLSKGRHPTVVRLPTLSGVTVSHLDVRPRSRAPVVAHAGAADERVLVRLLDVGRVLSEQRRRRVSVRPSP